MMVRLALAALAIVYSCDVITATSTISTFSDTECKKSLQELEAQDGFPDGICTNFHRQATRSTYKSFMFTNVDFGCSGLFWSNSLGLLVGQHTNRCAVTLYGDDTTEETCSATLKITAQPAVCYNSTWQYYSVDLCTPPSLIPTSATASPLATGTAATNTGGGNVGAIVGGVVGGVVFLAAVGTAALWFLSIRPKRRRRQAEEEAAAAAAAAAAEEQERKWKAPPPIVEAPGPGPAELPPGYYYDHELTAESPPVELPGRE